MTLVNILNYSGSEILEIICFSQLFPTSVGYGSNFEGLSSLLGMLNSCVPGISVVNIDNGFGAGCAVYRGMKTYSSTKE